ncbi:hypothetical protein BGX33_005139 [Mortierella sp. NVP41]|nr:hypothetical protein BGX33_005139 [Mortierella sp. NVP41]
MQQGTTFSSPTNDQARGPQQDAVEAFVTERTDNSVSPTEHPTTLADEAEGTPALTTQQKTSSDPTASTFLTVPPSAPQATPKTPEHSKSITEEFVEMKHNLLDVLQSMERLGVALVEAKQLSAQEASVESVKRSINDLLHANKDRPAKDVTTTRNQGHRAPKTGGRKFSRPFYPRNRQNNWSLKVFEPYNLKPMETLDNVELKESTIKCLETDGVALNDPDFIEKHILSPLVNGEDATLQIRGHKLQDSTFYAIVDVLDHASPEVQVVILINRTTVKSSQILVDSLRQVIDHAELNVDLHVIPDDKNLDLRPLAKSTPNKPCVFIATPPTFGRMKEAGVMRPKDVHVLAVYEAEYVLQSNLNVETIKAALADFEVCQVILACQNGTADVVKAEEQFNFTDEKITFSHDYVNILSAHHSYFTGNTMMEAIMRHTVELAKTNTVVVVCHDGHEALKMREQLKGQVELLITSRAAEAKAESGGVTGGMFVTSVTSSQVLEGSPHTPVRFVLNLAGTTLQPESYLRMMGSYMDIGEECTILSKVGSATGLKDLEELGIEFEAISDPAQL